MNGYTVHFENEEKHHYDDVVILDGGWISCYIDNPHGENTNVKFPPRRVSKVKMEVRQ